MQKRKHTKYLRMAREPFKVFFEDDRRRSLLLKEAQIKIKTINLNHISEYIWSQEYWAHECLWEEVILNMSLSPKQVVKIVIKSKNQYRYPWLLLLKRDDVREYLKNKSLFFKIFRLPDFVFRDLSVKNV